MDPSTTEYAHDMFIVSGSIVQEFFKSHGFENAEWFFVYLSTQCNHKKAYMIPSVYDKIVESIESHAKGNENVKTTLLSYFKNWIVRADQVGNNTGTLDEQIEMELLHDVLRLLNPGSQVILISDKQFSAHIPSLTLDKFKSYSYSNTQFAEFLKLQYGVNDGSSY